MELPETLMDLVDQFSKIPGVGQKTALRQVLFLTKWNKGELHTFAKALDGLCDLKHCEKCGMFSDFNLCKICSNEGRFSSTHLCIVESASDLLAIERSGQYDGKFHILGGVLNPLLGIGPDELNLDFLVERIKKEEVETVILAVNPSVEGDATCSYIRGLLPENVIVDRIGFGIPMGGSLEHLDSLTISKALENRRKM